MSFLQHQRIEILIEYSNDRHRDDYTCEFKQRDFINTDSQRLFDADYFIPHVKTILRKMGDYDMITIYAMWNYKDCYNGNNHVIMSKRYCKWSWGELHWSRWNEEARSYGRETAAIAKDGWIYDEKLNLVKDIREYVEAANKHLLKVLTENKAA